MLLISFKIMLLGMVSVFLVLLILTFSMNMMYRIFQTHALKEEESQLNSSTKSLKYENNKVPLPIIVAAITKYEEDRASS